MKKNTKTIIHKAEQVKAQHIATIKVEDLAYFDTSAFIKSDADRLDFLADIIQDKNLDLLSHACKLIQRSWDQENVEK